MKVKCPACGIEMINTIKSFNVNGDKVTGIEHMQCENCGEISFTPKQMDELHGYRIAQKQFKSA